MRGKNEDVQQPRSASVHPPAGKPATSHTLFAGRAGHQARHLIQWELNMGRTSQTRILGIALALAFIVFVPQVHASDSNEATLITFTRSVRIPRGIDLPAGTYRFTSVNSGAVVIANAEGTRFLAIVPAMPVPRRNTSLGTELSFAEPASRRQPIVLLTWFYPDNVVGHRFMYSSREASQIAEERQVTLMAMPHSDRIVAVNTR